MVLLSMCIYRHVMPAQFKFTIIKRLVYCPQSAPEEWHGAYKIFAARKSC